MFNIVILAVGKIKEKYFEEAAGEYQKRLRPYAKIVIEEVLPEPFGRESERKAAKSKEGERLLGALAKYSNDEVIILDERGKEFASAAFADFLDKEKRRVIFVVGGALGFSEEFLAKPFHKVSLSKMTLPHELARVVLFEQIYRAAAIVAGKTYHY